MQFFLMLVYIFKTSIFPELTTVSSPLRAGATEPKLDFQDSLPHMIQLKSEIPKLFS